MERHLFQADAVQVALRGTSPITHEKVEGFVYTMFTPGDAFEDVIEPIVRKYLYLTDTGENVSVDNMLAYVLFMGFDIIHPDSEFATEVMYAVDIDFQKEEVIFYYNGNQCVIEFENILEFESGQQLEEYLLSTKASDK